MTAASISAPFAHESLRTIEKWGLFALFAFFTFFGVQTEIRSAFSSTRMTDFGCYQRAAWAVRSGADIYDVQDDNFWHYTYTPVFAVAMTPLADAPADYPRDGMLPYAVSVALWYAFGIFCACLAIHWIAGSLEHASSDPSTRLLRFGCRRWWYNRVPGLLVCLIPVGGTLQRGQVNLLVLVLIAGMFRDTVRHRRFASGLWLAAAICVKIIPAFLVLFPLVRRDGRALGGLLAGLVIGMFLVPSAVWGVRGSFELHRKMATEILFPGILGTGNPMRDLELLAMTGTNNHSIRGAAHNLQYWDQVPRPTRASSQTKFIHLAISLLLSVAVLWRPGARRGDDAVRALLFLGSLLAVMIAVSPVSHRHYYCFLLPLVLALQAADQRRARSSRLLIASFIVTALVLIVSDLPIWRGHQQAGLNLVCIAVLLPLALYDLLPHPGRSAKTPFQQVAISPKAA